MRAEDALNLAKAYIKKSLDGAGALKGEKGDPGTSVSIVNNEKIDGVTTVTFSDGTVISIADGKEGTPGASVTIVSAEKVDGVATMIFSDGTTMEVKDGVTGTVSVRTGGFATEYENIIYTQISAPVTNPVITRDADGNYMCVSGDGSAYVLTSPSIVNPQWTQNILSGVSGAIRQVIYSPAHGCYYAIGTSVVYCSYDFIDWFTATLSTDNIDSMPVKAYVTDEGVFFLCDTGEVLMANSTNPGVIDTIGVTHDGASDFFVLHDCYIFQGGQNNPIGGIYLPGSATAVEKYDAYAEGAIVELRKMVYCYGKLFGLNDEGDLFMCDARYQDELVDSYWTCISGIDCIYNNGIENITDEKLDIFASEGKLYIVGNQGVYHLSRDLEMVSLQSREQQLNVQKYQTDNMTIDEGILYKRNSNELLLFPYEYEEIEATVAIQRMYSKLI